MSRPATQLTLIEQAKPRRATARKRTAREKERTKTWLATPDGREWLQRKIADKNATRRDPGPYPFPPTKFPFSATINGVPVTVWPDSIDTHCGTIAAAATDPKEET